MAPQTARYAPAPVAPAPRWREYTAGVLMVIGLTWPFLLSSVIRIPWWAFVPFALLGGLLRYRNYPHDTRVRWPLLAFIGVLLLYVLLASSLMPMPDYGGQKAFHFLLFAIAAYLATARQAPLTAELGTGIRWGLAGTMLLAMVVVFLTRDLFLETQKYGMEEMRQLFSVTGFPLSIAMAAVWVIPRTLRPLPVFFTGGVLLLSAALEIFVRGRFAAVTLAILAVMLVLGPPWRYLFSRILLSTLLILLFLGTYFYLLPSFGESYQYLESMLQNPFENRDLLFTVAWRGFMAHPMGMGLGSFVNIGMLDNYPHNIFLEVAYEMGLPGLLTLAAVYVVAIRRIWILWLSPPHRVLAALLLVVLLYMLKAGDIATWTFQWVYLYMLVVATPIARSWPLLRGEALS